MDLLPVADVAANHPNGLILIFQQVCLSGGQTLIDLKHYYKDFVQSLTVFTTWTVKFKP